MTNMSNVETRAYCRFVPGHAVGSEWEPDAWVPIEEHDQSLTIAELIRESHATAVEKGWWEKYRPFSEGIALMHSELSEALEEWRKYGMNQKMLIYTEADVLSGLGGKPEGIAVEFADLLIRIGDWCGKHAIPLEEALRAKMAYNKTRLHRHGGKLA